MLLTKLINTGELDEAFLASVDGLAKAFRNQYGLGAVDQLGIIVPDAIAAALELERMGVSPFFIAHGDATQWIEDGRSGHMSGKLGSSNLKDLELELIEAGHGSDFYKKDMDPEGRMFIQHLAFFVDDVDAWVRKFAADGHRLRIRGKLYRGPSKCDFAYIDTISASGFITEVFSHRFMGFLVKRPPIVNQILGRCTRMLGKKYLNV